MRRLELTLDRRASRESESLPDPEQAWGGCRLPRVGKVQRAASGRARAAVGTGGLPPRDRTVRTVLADALYSIIYSVLVSGGTP